MKDFNYYNANRFNMDLNLYCCGNEQCNPNQFWGPGVREDHLIHYINSGQGFFTIKDKKYHVKSGQCFYIPANEKIFYTPDKTTPWNYTYVGFIGTKASAMMSKTNISASNPIFSVDDISLVHCLNEILNVSSDNSNFNDYLLMSKLYQFLHLLSKNYPCDNIDKEYNIKQKYLNSTLLYINKNYNSNITVVDIANYLNIDKSYIHKIFKELMNTTPRQYLINFRLNIACELLRNQSLYISDVARSVGYNDVLLFSKIFKKFKGCTPSEYKQMLT